MCFGGFIVEFNDIDAVTGRPVPKKIMGLNLVTIYNQRYLLFMSAPFVIWVLVFAYWPLWGWTMAFQKYRPGLGFFQQEWVGLKNFVTLFTDPNIPMVMRNTLVFSLLEMTIGFALPVILAVLLYEVRSLGFRRVIQTVSYLPHFVSWVVAANIVITMLSMDGPVNQMLVALHVIDKPVIFMAKGSLFWGICFSSGVWKEIGWGSIIYIAAIAGIDPELYEAAMVDGAGRFKRIWHITLPGISSTMLVIFMLKIGWLLSVGFEQQLLLSNSFNLQYSTVLDVFIFRTGLGQFNFSYATAAGMFKSVISITLLLMVNSLGKKWADTRVI